MADKKDRRYIYALVRHYNQVIEKNKPRIKQLVTEKKFKHAKSLESKLVGIGQYHTDLLEILVQMRIPFEELHEEFREEFEVQTPRTKHIRG